LSRLAFVHYSFSQAFTLSQPEIQVRITSLANTEALFIALADPSKLTIPGAMVAAVRPGQYLSPATVAGCWSVTKSPAANLTAPTTAACVSWNRAIEASYSLRSGPNWLRKSLPAGKGFAGGVADCDPDL
jgi:hypothetical protein